MDQRYVLSSRQYLQQQILNRFANHRSLVADELGRFSTKVSLTADVWTSITNQAYLGVTVHYIDDEWNMQHYLLDLIHFEHHHTGTRTKEKLLQLIDEMNLNGKVLSLTTDNDATMVLCGKHMTNEFGIVWNDSEFQHYQCAAYVLNIAISHGMQLRVRIIDKVRTFVNKIRHSTVLCDALRSYCKVIKKDYLKPDLDIATRWNSIFLMLEKFKRMREELDFFVCSNKHLETAYLNNDEWE